MSVISKEKTNSFGIENGIFKDIIKFHINIELFFFELLNEEDKNKKIADIGCGNCILFNI